MDFEGELAAPLARRSLERRDRDPFSAERERLRAAYMACQRNAVVLGTEISRELPDYTIHDAAHAEGIWDMAGLIAGPDYALTPTETLVFGCALHIHDLAMASSLLPSSIEDLVGRERWLDTIVAHLREAGIEETQEAREAPPAEVTQKARKELLREFHAENSARLANRAFRDTSTNNEHYLIDDADIRTLYSDLVGRIAASHGWDSSRIAKEFAALPLGAPSWLPSGWTVDPIKLACLLRVADAGHIDSRRAPVLLKIAREPSNLSRDHWIFQERLQRPWLDGDRLVYSSPQPFETHEASAWWLCVDTLRMFDRELRAVDSILSDSHKPRFSARAVAFVEDPARLSQHISVRGWFPVDARIEIGDAIGIIRDLGGEKLYGNDASVPVREILMNGADAVRARRALESAQGELEFRPRVQVTLEQNEVSQTLVFRDFGIGMSREVMAKVLLDFGRSYWNTPAARRDLPGLMSSDFRPTGKFGIGFFSVFMLGDEIKVVSRRFDAARNSTHVLHFMSGLHRRPILRLAEQQEQLAQCGTEITVVLSDVSAQALQEQGIGDMSRFFAREFPAMDLDIEVRTGDESFDTAVSADDWWTCDPLELVRRTTDASNAISMILSNMRLMTSPDGTPLARAAIVPQPKGGGASHRTAHAVVTVGGAVSASTIQNVVGIFPGQTTRAARDSAVPGAPPEIVAAWATEQAALCRGAALDPAQELSIAELVVAFGGHPGPLVIALSSVGYLTAGDLAEWVTGKDEIWLIQDAAYSLRVSQHVGYESLVDNALVANVGVLSTLTSGPRFWRSDWEFWPVNPNLPWPSMAYWIAFEIGAIWGVPRSFINDQLERSGEESKAYEQEHSVSIIGESLPYFEDANHPHARIVTVHEASAPITIHVTRITRSLEENDGTTR